MKKSPLKTFTIKFQKLVFASLFLLLTQVLFSQTAPVSPPKGGFKIDGLLRANVAANGTIAAGDWVPRLNSQDFTAGVDSFVLNNSGAVKDAITTKLQRDLYNSNNDDVFTQGSKFNDYISALHWGLSGAPNKNDIHNGVFHASGNPGNGDQWVFIGGDRLDVSGTSYIDFQFLQGTVVPNTTTNSTFIGSGPAGGRTISDINVSMEYNNGGTAPKVVIYRWAPSNEAGTAWAWDSTGSASITQAYAKTNLVAADVPFGGFVYGALSEFSYQPFAFVEAAINVTQLVTALGGNCSGLSIKTLWITTKASSSSTAALKDFIAPISLDLTFGGVTIDQKGPVCALSSNITLTAIPSGGTFSGTGVTGNVFSPTDAGVGTHTISYVASAGVNCTKTATMDIIVNPLPSVTVNSPVKCANAANVSVTATPGSGAASDYNYSWSVPAGASDPGNVSSFTTGIAGNYTVVITKKSTGCVSPPGIGLVTVNPNPAVTVNSTAICASNISATMTASPSGGTPGYTYAWSVPAGMTNPGSVVSFNATVAGNYSVVVTDSKNCPSAAGTGNLTINANPTVSVNTTAICGSVGSATMTATPAGGTSPFTYAWSVPAGMTNPGSVVSFNATVAGNYSVVITDSKGCSSPKGSGSLTINSNPDAPVVSVINPSCSVTLGSITVTSPVGGSYQYSYNGGSFGSSTGPYNFAAGAGYSIVAKNTSTGCVSAATSCAAEPGSLNNSLTNSEATARNLGSATLEASVTVKAMPNPFSNQVRFVINSTEQGDGTLDIYNVLGQKIKTIYKGNIPAGTSYFDLKLPGQSRNLVYVLKINDQKISGTLTQLGSN